MKIAVLGSHPQTKMQAPFGDPEWKIWACSPHNYSMGRLPRVDEWFELHKPAQDPDRVVKAEDWLEHFGEEGRITRTKDGKAIVVMPPTRPQDYLEWVRDEVSKQIPVWVRDTEFFAGASTWPDPEPAEFAPRGLFEFPEDDLKREFGPFSFTSSIAHILAMAVVARPEVIGIWGVMQASPTEYTYQRPGIQALLFEAHRRGIGVVVPDESGLFTPPDNQW